MVHITKLQLQTTFPKPLYIPHSACIHRDPGHRRQQIYVGFVDDIDIKILGVHPLRPGMPFLDSDTCAVGGGVNPLHKRNVFETIIFSKFQNIFFK
jgi:hypothetical protein